jgi:hypothetical protein
MGIVLKNLITRITLCKYLRERPSHIKFVGLLHGALSFLPFFKTAQSPVPSFGWPLAKPAFLPLAPLLYLNSPPALRFIDVNIGVSLIPFPENCKLEF